MSLAFDVEGQPTAPRLPHQWFSDLCGGLEAHELLGDPERDRTTHSEGVPSLRIDRHFGPQ